MFSSSLFIYFFFFFTVKSFMEKKKRILTSEKKNKKKIPKYFASRVAGTTVVGQGPGTRRTHEGSIQSACERNDQDIEDARNDSDLSSEINTRNGRGFQRISRQIRSRNAGENKRRNSYCRCHRKDYTLCTRVQFEKVQRKTRNELTAKKKNSKNSKRAYSNNHPVQYIFFTFIVLINENLKKKIIIIRGMRARYYRFHINICENGSVVR